MSSTVASRAAAQQLGLTTRSIGAVGSSPAFSAPIKKVAASPQNLQSKFLPKIQHATVAKQNAGRISMAGERSYKITLLPGDGIGPEIIKVAVDVLKEIGSQEGKSHHPFCLGL